MADSMASWSAHVLSIQVLILISVEIIELLLGNKDLSASLQP